MRRGAALMLALCAARAASLELTLKMLTDPEARCLDGSRAGYYFRGGELHFNWLLLQESAGVCTDEQSCRDRTPDQRGSASWPLALELEGLFAPAVQALVHGNMVLIKDCSGDAGAGNSTSFGLEFAGRAILSAVLADLLANRPLFSSNHHLHVLYGGGGLAARGALLNADFVRSTLTAGLGDQLERFALLLDAGVEVDVEPLDSKLPGLEQRLSAWAAVSGASQFASPACLAAQQPSEAWRCLAAEHALEFVQSDIIARAPLYDRDQLAAGGLTGPPVGPLQIAFAEAVRAQTSLTLVRATAGRRGSGALLPACFSGSLGLQAGNGWREETVDGTSMEAAVDAWFYAKAAPLLSRLLEDGCEGFGCGAGCEKS